MAEINGEPRGVRGWLIVLCGWLLLWEPLNAGAVIANGLAALSYRGPSLAVLLLLRLVVTALGIAAGLSLVFQRASAIRLAATALLLSAATDVVVYTTSFLPSNRMPGDEWFYVSLTIVVHGGWFAYLLRSRRVRNTYL